MKTLLLLSQCLCMLALASAKTVEVGLFATSDLVDAFYEKFELEAGVDREGVFKSNILLQYQEGIHSMFTDPTLTSAGVNVDVVITEVNIVDQADWNSWTSLSHACAYQSGLPGTRDASLFVALSGGAVQSNIGFSAGRGYTNVMCNSAYGCAIVAETAFLNAANSRLAAHELGHVFGLIDQGYQLQYKLNAYPSLVGTGLYVEPMCPESSVVSIMAGNGYTWSSCSVTRMTGLVPNIACGDNVPTEQPVSDMAHLVGKKYPSREEQCHLLKEPNEPENYVVYYNPPSGTPDECKYADYECYKHMPTEQYPYRYYYMNGAPLLTGTPCGTGNQFCQNGQCVSPDSFVTETTETGTGGSGGSGGPTECYPGWAEYNGHCYKYFYDAAKVSQPEAQSRCQTNYQANLVTIDSADVNSYIANTFGITRFWIGLYRTGGNWFWYDGTPYSYSSWATNHPRAGQDCASMGSSTYPDKWFTKDCNRSSHNRYYYICDLKLAAKK